MLGLLVCCYTRYVSRTNLNEIVSTEVSDPYNVSREDTERLKSFYSIGSFFVQN